MSQDQAAPCWARAFREASRQEQLKLEVLVSLQLLGKLQPTRGLDAVIEDMSRQALERGLTPEILEALLIPAPPRRA